MARVTRQGVREGQVGPGHQGAVKLRTGPRELAGGGRQGYTRTEPAQCVLHCPHRPHLGNAVKGKITKNFKMVTADY